MVILLTLLVAASTSVASAQTAKNEVVVYTTSPAPTVSLTADQSVIQSCGRDGTSAPVRLNAVAEAVDGNPVQYRWTADGGRIEGSGPTVTWDLAGLKPGYYNAFLEITTGSPDRECQAFSSVGVLLRCPPGPVCPTVAIVCPERVDAGQPVTFTSTLTGDLSTVTPVYNWTVTGGRIIEGQGTSSIRVATEGLEGQTLTARLEVGGYELECAASCPIQVPIAQTCRRFDEFSNISRNNEKARLDNFAIELQNDPTATGYVIIHPGSVLPPSSGQLRSNRITDYLVNSRGLNSRRLINRIGSPETTQRVELWVCPQGTTPN